MQSAPATQHGLNYRTAQENRSSDSGIPCNFQSGTTTQTFENDSKEL